jgi:hypothetical protein
MASATTEAASDDRNAPLFFLLMVVVVVEEGPAVEVGLPVVAVGSATQFGSVPSRVPSSSHVKVAELLLLLKPMKP